MAQERDKRTTTKPVTDPWHDDTWLLPLPVPEAVEGGESTWELWHEAARQLDAAFAPTQPSEQAPLSAGITDEPAPPPARGMPRTADSLMVVARRNNRVCPQPALWTRLYRMLGGSGYMDLQPPPVDQWIWTKVSDLQKRLYFREHLEWAERHGKLEEVARFLDELSEPDWVHMGD